jgi:hypothetical protein
MRAHSGELFDTTALFDSGADVSMFSPSVAEILGVKVKNGRRRIFRGLGGAVEAYVHHLHFNVGSLRFCCSSCFQVFTRYYASSRVFS